MSRSFPPPSASPRPRVFPLDRSTLLLVLALAACSGAQPAPQVEGVPAWLPVYPDSEVQPLFEAPNAEGGTQGAVSFRVPAEAGEVVKFYRDQLEAADFEVEVLPFRSDVGRGVRIEGGDSKTGFHAIVTEEDDGTATVVANYTEKP